jgi:hypothetical protein
MYDVRLRALWGELETNEDDAEVHRLQGEARAMRMLLSGPRMMREHIKMKEKEKNYGARI